MYIYVNVINLNILSPKGPAEHRSSKQCKETGTHSWDQLHAQEV